MLLSNIYDKLLENILSPQRACCMLKNEPQSAAKKSYVATMIPGDGVGPELMASVKDVFSEAGVPVEFEELFIRYWHFLHLNNTKIY